MTLCDGPQTADKRVSSTIAWKLDRIQYAYEGNITVTGSGLSWALALTGFKELEVATKLATDLEDNGNVYFVPALAGLGAPHWDEEARGSIVGLSFGTRKENVVRAALEAIAFQVKDVLDREVMRSRTAELSGLGAAFAAGLGCGFWSSTDEVAGVIAPHDLFRPQLEDRDRTRLIHGWNNAVASVKMLSAASSQRQDQSAIL